jgi:hypothetical protein
VERHVVVVFLARELLHARGVLRRDVIAQFDNDAALGRVDQKRVLGIDTGGQ